jgi:hypothetical protein
VLIVLLLDSSGCSLRVASLEVSHRFVPITEVGEGLLLLLLGWLGLPFACRAIWKQSEFRSRLVMDQGGLCYRLFLCCHSLVNQTSSYTCSGLASILEVDAHEWNLGRALSLIGSLKH